MFWEIGRAISAFLTGMFYPQAVFMKVIYPNFVYYIIILDILAAIDMYMTCFYMKFQISNCCCRYVRFHVGYYNKRGVLVTHPKYTALNYLSHAFMLDLLGVLPLGYLLSLFTAIDYDDPESVEQYYRIFAILSLSKLFQMYRVPDAFAYFQRDIMKRQKVFL